MKLSFNKIKTLLKVLVRKEFSAYPDHSYSSLRLGREFASFNVIVSGLCSSSIVYSFGVGEDVSFDLALIEGYGATVHAFDPTPKSISWVASQKLPERFIMHEYGLAGFDGDVAFNPPENPEHVSHTILSRPSTASRALTVPVRRLSTIMAELGHKCIDVLKMDIEGAEYDVIDDLAKGDIRPKQILVEFHHRFPGVGLARTKHCITILERIGYKLFSVSDTNEEFGFVLSGGDPPDS